MPPSEPAVLVVAADPATASHLGAPLTSAGYAVEMVAEIPEAQARLRAGGIDLVVLHVAAPAPAHRAFCAWVRQQVGDLYLPLIVVRAAPTAVDRQPLCAAGADECLDEPLAPADLLARVQVWMRVRQRLRAACDRLMGQHAALRASDARLRELLENLDAIVWEADAASWQIVFVSSRATVLLGYPTTQWLTEPAFWRRIVHPEDRETVARWLAAAPAGDARESEFRVVAADGRVVWLHHLLYLAPPDPAHPCRLCGISFDITARKQLEERLHQAQKLESIGRLAGGIAHDFNNLLTVINGFSEVLLQQLAPAAPHRAYIAEIAKAGERAAALTQQLLAFSRRQVLQPRVLDLNAIVTDTSTILRRLIGEDIALELRLGPGLAAVYADPAQLSQVLLNLAANARDAMPQGGRLTIQTANVVVDTAFAARHPPTQPGAYVQLAVIDTGCGIPPEVQAHIFEPFFTTKERGHGTGLGLATVYGIVKQSG
ncbi:MAG TPA: ATP-binding protein, partial [Chloroflexota bacterium]|nr:ATP-binding protein [Chloroflexota bacterium]